MSPPLENETLVRQRETLRTALDELRGKIELNQSQQAAGLEVLREEVEMLAERLEAISEDQLEREGENASSDPPASVECKKDAVGTTTEPRKRDVAEAARGPAESTRPFTDDIGKVILGSELAAGAADFGDRGQLIQGVYENEDAALNLVGQIMVFRGASAERRPQLLKEIGEAYYRWRGAGAMDQDTFRDRIVAYLVQECESSGVPIAVELVRVGDRYDSKRHHAKQRGVEVIGVEGWVVLRGGNKVYTKASVVLQ